MKTLERCDIKGKTFDVGALDICCCVKLEFLALNLITKQREVCCGIHMPIIALETNRIDLRREKRLKKCTSHGVAETLDTVVKITFYASLIAQNTFRHPYQAVL